MLRLSRSGHATCRTCTKRRVKCDGARPHCRKCTQKGLECPGVESGFDLVVRNQNSLAKQRVDRRIAKRDSEHASSCASSETSSLLSCRRTPSPLSTHLQPDPAAIATALFLEASPSLGRIVSSEDPSVVSLRPFLANCQPGSMVELATSTISLATLAKSRNEAGLQQLAFKHYGQILRKFRDSLCKPSFSIEDAVLVTQLVVMFEHLVSTDMTTFGRNNHADGLAILLKLKHFPEQDVDDKQLFMFRMARMHIAFSKMQLSQPMPPYPHPDGWFWMEGASCSWHDCGIMAHGLAVVDLRYRSKLAHAAPSFGQQLVDIAQVGAEAVALHQQLTLWETAHPLPYVVTRIDASYHLPTKDVPSAPIWPGELHIFDCHIHSSLSQVYHTLQLWTLGIAIRSYAWQCRFASYTPGGQDRAQQQLCGLQAAIQLTVNNICANVPFAVGLDADFQFPPDLAHLEQHRPQFKGGGSNTMMLWLWYAMTTEDIPEVQREWIRGRLKYISTSIGVGIAGFLAENAPPSLIYDGLPLRYAPVA